MFPRQQQRGIQPIGLPPSIPPGGGGGGGGFGPPLIGPPPTIQPPGNPGSIGPTSAWQVYRTAAPEMARAAQKNVWDTMQQAGFGGNRYSQGAMRQAGDIGADLALQQNRLLADTLYNQTNTSADRAMQAEAQRLGFQQQHLDRAMQAALGGLGHAQTGYDRALQAELGRQGLWQQHLGRVGDMAMGGMGFGQANQDRALQAELARLGFGQQHLDRSLQATMGGMGTVNEQLQRELAAAGQGMGAANAIDAMTRNRFQDMFGMGQWEQELADKYAMIAYQDFEKNKLGYLPMLMQGMGRYGSPYQGQGVTTTTAATPGALDYLSQILPFFFL